MKNWQKITGWAKKSSDGRWAFRVEKDRLKMIRTWIGAELYSLRFESKNGYFVVHVADVNAALVGFDSRSAPALREEINTLLDEMIDPTEYLE